MAITDINPSMDGIGSNPGLMIRAPQHVVGGTEIVYDSRYLDGAAVRGNKTGQTLMESPWLAEGVLNNIVAPIIYIYDGNGSSPLTEEVDAIGITIFKRDPKTKLVVSTSNLKVLYNSTISPTVGSMPFNSLYNRAATGYYFFDRAYEYKFVVSVKYLTSGAYMDVDALYIQYTQRNGIVSSRQVAYGSGNNWPTEQIPVIEGLAFTVTSSAGVDGECKFDVTLPVELWNGGSATGYGGTTTTGSAFAMYYQAGVRTPFYRVDSITPSYLAGAFSNDGRQMVFGDTSGVDAYGGLNIRIKGYGLYSATQYWVWVNIFGYQDPQAV